MTMATVFAGVIALDRGHRLPLARVRRRSRRAGAIWSSILAIVGFILAPYAALLLRMSLSRRREFLADAGAAEILSDPEAMALALRRLELDSTTIRYADASTAHLWVESPTDRVGLRAPRSPCALELVQHASADSATRIAALEEAGGFRLPERLPPDTPFGVELGLV